jgi:hypothetical protein
MEASSAIRIEKGLDRSASVLFGAAAAYAGWAWLSPMLDRLTATAAAGAIFAAGYCVTVRALGAVQPKKARRLRVFDVREVGPVILTREPAVEPEEPEVESDALVLDDILAKLAPDSRVVRLFDKDAMPTPAQLRARIEDHLDMGASGSADASQALHEALAELRRSLR